MRGFTPWAKKKWAEMIKPYKIIVITLISVTAASPVSNIYAYVVADAGEETAAEPYATEIAPAPETMPAEDPLEGENDYICFDCRLVFVTEKEYVEHIKAKHPSKWEAMKSDYEGWFEEYDNALTIDKDDTNEVNKTVRIIFTAGFIAAVGLILFVSIYDNKPKLLPFDN
jgi:uncharacterized C2H2 Zn-finger protein